MPKVVAASTIDLMNEPTGTEPVLVVGINFGGGTDWYATRDLGWAKPSILSIGECSFDKRSDNAGSSGSVQVTFSDHDGSLKFVQDNTLMERAPCKLFLHYPNNPRENMLCLLNGRIGGPISWNEAERTLTLNLDSTIETGDAGFTPTDEFDDVAPEAKNTAWPMIFGKCAHVPAVHARKKSEGALQTPIRLKSSGYIFDKAARKFRIADDCKVQSYLGAAETTNKIYVLGGKNFPQNQTVKITIDGVIFIGSFTDDVFTVTVANAPAFENIPFIARPVPERKDSEKYKIARVSATTVNIQGYHIYIKDNNPWHNLCVKQEKGVCEFIYDFISPADGQKKLINETYSIQAAYSIMKNGLDNDKSYYFEELLRSELNNNPANSLKLIQGITRQLLDDVVISSDNFWSRPAGTPVRLWDTTDPDIYIVSCVPCSSVDAVYGKRTITYEDGTQVKMFVPIPSDYYQIQLASNYQVNGAYVTGLLFPLPLKDFKEERWDDTVYVTATSTVGPNTSDIIRYIIQTYAPELVINGRSFDDVADQIDGVPSNFAIFDRRNAIQLAQEIAWQARCALLLDGAEVTLIFLDQDRDADYIMWELNTLASSGVELGNTPATEIRTKMVCLWQDAYRNVTIRNNAGELEEHNLINRIRDVVSEDNDALKESQHIYVYRENVAKFGERTEEREIFIYNEEQYVALTAAYWGHVMANSWRTVRLSTFLSGANLQPFDKVIMLFTSHELAGYSGLVGDIIHASFNWSEKVIALEVRLDATAGT